MQMIWRSKELIFSLVWKRKNLPPSHQLQHKEKLVNRNNSGLRLLNYFCRQNFSQLHQIHRKILRLYLLRKASLFKIIQKNYKEDNFQKLSSPLIKNRVAQKNLQLLQQFKNPKTNISRQIVKFLKSNWFKFQQLNHNKIHKIII